MHLDEGTIHAWLDGALDAEEAARVEQHAAACAACAAAVAEARGLVAGASRILTALDGVPGGIVPKTAAAGGTSRARRTRSLWTTLHLTPARAAAAAVVVVAAGTALVLHNVPNGDRSPVKLARYPADSAVTFRPAPMSASRPAPDTAATSQALAAPVQAAPSPVVMNKAAPRPVAAPGRRASLGGQDPEARVSGVAVAQKAKAARAVEVAVSDSTGREKSVDSLSAQKESAMARSLVADNAARGAVAGVVPRAAAAPPSAATRQYDAARRLPDARSIAGCYVVATDSAITLPARLWLDSALVAQTPTLQRSLDRHGVSEIANATRRSIAGAYWAPRPDGSIRLSLPASSVNVDLAPVSASTLVGAMTVGGRSLTVTLRRAECGS